MLLNDIIAIGGTTAFEDPLTESEFENQFISGAHCLCCFLAESDTQVVGFQSLILHSKLPENWADIATFARAKPKVPGVGTALFDSTLAFAREQGFAALNATIRADNRSGLAYYSKMGFQDYAVDPGVPLKDGTPVDRVSKRYAIE
ncbi:MAG: GNAT family N-acetyltransferase [Pseudomonadota bacterium]